MSDIKNSTFAPGLELRVLDRNGEPWFFAKDVCDALGLNTGRTGTGALIDHLDEDEKDSFNLNTVISNHSIRRGYPIVKVVNESGLYALIMRSRKPEARAFKKWVTSEVLCPRSARRAGTWPRAWRTWPC